MPPPFNKRATTIGTPAGSKPSFAAASGFTGGDINKVQVHYSCGVDAANPPPATSLRGDPFSVTRVSQGLYRFKHGGATDALGAFKPSKQTITAEASLQKSAVSVLGAEIAAIDDTNGTVDVRVVNRSTGAVADPVAAGANERLHLVVTFDNGAV